MDYISLESRLFNMEAKMKALNMILTYMSVMNTAIFVCLLGIVLRIYF